MDDSSIQIQLQLHTILSQLAADIRDEAKSLQLERNVLLRLNFNNDGSYK